ncbi:hypothetical protein, partial [Limosilactobacillus fermentum]|uniref:hypothetical protein n=1 Tax=Limosilactobacillus fermentum TaxID=1613 RepID=UPI001C9E6662
VPTDFHIRLVMECLPKNVAENIDVESQEQAPKKDAPNVLPKQKAGPVTESAFLTSNRDYLL